MEGVAVSNTFDAHFMTWEPSEPEAAQIALSETGLVTFLASGREAFLRQVSAIGDVVPHRDSNRDGVTVVAFDPDLAGNQGYAAMSCGPLRPHTDSSGLPSPPGAVALYCEESSGSGGETFLVDGYQLHESLSHDHPLTLEALTRAASVVFRSGDSLYNGAIFEQTVRGKLAVRLRLDDLGYFSADLVPHMLILQQYIQHLGLTLNLTRGQGYIIDNLRFLHGRRPFHGKRRMLRLLVNPGLPQAASDWPDHMVGVTGIADPGRVAG